MSAILHKFYVNFFSPKRNNPFVEGKYARRTYTKPKNKGAEEECG